MKTKWEKAFLLAVILALSPGAAHSFRFEASESVTGNLDMQLTVGAGMRTQSWNPQLVGDLSFWILVSSLVGARVFFILVNWGDYFGGNAMVATRFGRIPRFFALWEGGMVFYGGFIAAVAVCVVFLRRNRMPFLPVADASSIGIVLGLAFGRLGCTSAGCCFGKPTTLPWAITFTDPACLAPLHVPLHPTQIYESIGGFAIFGLLYATRDRFTTPGMRFWTMLILYGAARAFFEIFRDDPRGFVGPFSESQAVSAVLIAYAVVMIALDDEYRRRWNRQPPRAARHGRAAAAEGGDREPARRQYRDCGGARRP